MRRFAVNPTQIGAGMNRPAPAGLALLAHPNTRRGELLMSRAFGAKHARAPSLPIGTTVQAIHLAFSEPGQDGGLYLCRRRSSRSLLQLVQLNQRHARQIVIPTYNSGIGGRRKISDNGAFKVVRWWNARCNDLSLLIHPPVIIEGDQRTIAVVEPERRIRERIRHSYICEAGADRTEKYPRLIASYDDCAANHHIITCRDETTRG